MVINMTTVFMYWQAVPVKRELYHYGTTIYRVMVPYHNVVQLNVNLIAN